MCPVHIEYIQSVKVMSNSHGHKFSLNLRMQCSTNITTDLAKIFEHDVKLTWAQIWLDWEYDVKLTWAQNQVESMMSNRHRHKIRLNLRLCSTDKTTNLA